MTAVGDIDVFVSYSGEDERTANLVCEGLEAHGLRCWIAPRDILPGTSWSAAIMEAIERSRALLLIFSVHSNESQHVVRELESAVAGDVPIVPLRVDDTPPSKSISYFITGAQWLQVSSRPSAEQIRRLVEGVRRLAGRPAESDDAKAAQIVERRLAREPRRRVAPVWLAAAISIAVLAAAAWVCRGLFTRPRPAPPVAVTVTTGDAAGPADAPAVAAPVQTVATPVQAVTAAEPLAFAPGEPTGTSRMQPLAAWFGERLPAVVGCVREGGTCRSSRELVLALLRECRDSGVGGVDAGHGLTARQLAAVFDREDLAPVRTAALQHGAGVILAVMLDIDAGRRGQQVRVFERDVPAVDTQVRFLVAGVQDGPVLLNGEFKEIAGTRTEQQLATHATAILIDNYLVPRLPLIEHRSDARAAEGG